MSEYTLLIVDDELIIREGLVRSLNWSALGFRIVGTAQDGEEALEAFRTLRPDAVLLDIKMPGMSGLEALSAMKRERSETEVVLLSGFDEFSYAKEGIKEGAFDYILKIDMFAELESVFSRLRGVLEKHKTEHEQYNRLLEYKGNYEFQEYLRGREPAVANSGKGMNGLYCVASVRFDDPASEQTVQRRLESYRFALRHVMGVESRSAHVVFVDEGDADAFLGGVRNEMEALAIAVRGGSDALFVAGISTVKSSAADIPEAYREALRTTDYLHSCGGYGQCLQYGDWSGRLERVEYAMIGVTGWVNWVYAGDEERLIEWVKRVFAEAYASKHIAVSEIQAFALQVFLQFDKAMKEAEPESEGKSFEESDWLKGLDSLIDLEAAVLNAVRRRCQRLHERIHEPRHKSIVAIKEYVDEMFAMNLRLEEVAQRFHFSAGYLSAKFKEYTGKPFTKYLIDRRIEIACELLVGTEMKVYEIANQVGYTDERHFSKLFTQHRMIGPREYRKRHSKSDDT